MKKIIITEFINESSLIKLKRKFEINYNEKLWQNAEKINEIIKDFDGLIVRNKTNVNKHLIDAGNKLKFIGRLGVGLDNIDVEYCKSKKIHVQPATGMNADSVAEYVLTSAMALIKKIPILHEGTIIGEWPRTTIQSEEIKCKTLGLIGFGSIGQKVYEQFSKIDVSIIVFDPPLKESKRHLKNIKFVELIEVFNNADIISLHVPLTSDTKNLLNKNSFIKMKKKPIIINTSRGLIINENDLINAYKENLISGFALDVFQDEPVKSGLYKKISKEMNCILTPHISGVTIQSNKRVSDFIASKVIDFF